MPAHPVAMNTVATLPKDSNICTPPARALSATTSRDALRNTLRRSASAGPREVAFASHHPDHCSVHQRRTGKCGAGASDPEPLSEEGATCPPDTNGEPTTVGGGSSAPLSEKLARSKGVICPPAGIDRDMQVTPPGGGHIKVIPPPGTPGGGSKCAAEVVASMLRGLPSAPMATHDTDAQNEASADFSLSSAPPRSPLLLPPPGT